MKKWIRTIILVVVALALGLWAYFGERHLDKVALEKRLEQKITRIPTEKIAGFTLIINNPNAAKPDTTVVERVGADEWQIVHPILWPGESTEWRAIAQNLPRAWKQRAWKSSPDSISFFGLKPPLVRLIIKPVDSAMRPDTLDIGKATPTDNFCYVKYPRSDSIYTTDVILVSATLKSLHTLRDKSVTPIDPSLVQRITVKRGGADSMVIERRGNLWWMTSPLERSVDRDTVNALLKEVQMSRVAVFHDTPAAMETYGLDRPVAEVEFLMAYQGRLARRTLFLGSKVPNVPNEQSGGQPVYYVKDADRPPVMEVPGGLGYNLKRPMEFYWDRHLAVFERRDINRVELVTSERTVAMSADTLANWRFESPLSGGVKRWQVNGIVANLDMARVKQFVERPVAATGLDRPRLSVRLYHDKELKASVDFGAPHGGLVFARGSNNNGPVLVDKQTMTLFMLSVDDLKELPIPPQ